MTGGHNFISMRGRRFGSLVVISEVRRRTGRGNVVWRCQCDCGLETEVRGYHLRGGQVETCGAIVHRSQIGISKSAEYRSWQAMKTRCLNRNATKFASYGGRGILIWAPWDDFMVFLADMGPRPDGTTLERIDNDGHYEPGNCRWATRGEQARNTRRSLYVEHEGRAVLLCDLCSDLGLPYAVIHGRIRIGWTLDRALTVPVKSHR